MIRLPRSLRFAAPTAAVFVLAASPAAAQLPSASASALGLGDNYTALALWVHEDDETTRLML